MLLGAVGVFSKAPRAPRSIRLLAVTLANALFGVAIVLLKLITR